MTDNLRDRIAAAMMDRAAAANWLVYDDPRENFARLADAVIADLGLRRDPLTAELSKLLFGESHRPRHRYVTEWQPDA